MAITLDDHGDGLDAEPSEELKGRIKAELYPGERLIWASRRIPRVAPFRLGIWSVGITTLLCLYASGSVVAVFRNPLGELGGLVSFGFVAGLIGVANVIVLVLTAVSRSRELARAGNTFYALSNRRAIVWMPSYSNREATEVHAVPRGKLAYLHRVEYPDGTGDVVFSLVGNGGEDYYSGPGGFEGVSEVRRVEEQVRRILMSGEPTA